MTSPGHVKRAASKHLAVFCPVCEINVGFRFWKSHIAGHKHQKRSKRKSTSPDVDPQQAVNTAYATYCEQCGVLVPPRDWNKHVQKFRHRQKESYTAYRAALDEAEKNKNGVIVEGDLDFDIVDPTQWNNNVKRELVLKTTTPNLKVNLVSLKLTSARGLTVINNSVFTVTPDSNDRSITPRSSIKLVVKLIQCHIGRYEDRLELMLEDVQLKRQFMISRSVRAIIGNKADHENLKAKAPYVPQKRTDRKLEKTVVEGVRPPSLNAIPYVGKLPRALIPRALSDVLGSKDNYGDTIKRIHRLFMPAILDSDSFGRHWRTLLWIEEQKMEQDLERYDIFNANLTRHEGSYYVEVPGLAEKRPSVLIGDRILVQPHGGPEGHWYEGFVHFVRQKEIGLRFHQSFRGWNQQQLYHVRFKLNRIPLRRQHHAMDLVFQEDRVLFPLDTHVPARPRDLVSRLYNENIASNARQMQAVSSIVKLPPGSPPFVVFGPFGTGKTSTIIEAMLQVLNSNPQARVLACAPSNSAADLLVTKLRSHLDKEIMFRFNAPSRLRIKVPDDVMEYSYIKDDPHSDIRPFGVPMFRIKRFRVVVSTCGSASFAAGIGMPRGHFTHIFIDEAGQATEPEALLSVKTIADPNTNVVLSGDPKQLGPIIRSPIARELGLQVSYLERLMNRDAYDIKGYSGNTYVVLFDAASCLPDLIVAILQSVIKLLQNYRSHPAILKFPNEQFYGGELQGCAEAEKITRYLHCPLLPDPKFPIIFHAVYGKDDREASSPSFFNIDEALQIKQYVGVLRSSKEFKTSETDIGIIAPYHAQVLKVRAALRGYADEIKVGSVEEFQGQERPIIMISTVRSSKEFIEYDLRHTLGFVANPRRFNVAITRTQALLIIVGDPQVLSIDPMWRSFLNYIYNNNGWKGPSPDWDTTAPVDPEGKYDEIVREHAQLDMNEFARKMEEFTLDGVEEDDGGGVDQPWRETE
ncbi:hypothetical protein AMATHDRAFT_7405 [Amanita thiersii Skay4041]|uniref:RNA helicase n=1 Tax=Amanita thiersii Skay4041 TaxID=703135 RepID=A0A2A9NEV2_9AGAR|nr:hypothetical protein AMATHDRAFT_7405 [Amanita thiersii Skay4041]